MECGDEKGGVASGRTIIVIFGAAVRRDGSPSLTLRRRVEAAARCGAHFPGALYIPTGGKGRFGPPEASVMAALLQELGVPPGRIIAEPTGTDTLSSAVAVTRLLRTRCPVGTVLVATSAYHLPRCRLLMRLAGYPASACPPPPAPASARFALRWYWRMREVPAIPYDAGLMICRRVLGGL
jgi:uncharacterized SAM-binding protein YcdF (DUF218 family)